MVPQSRGRDPRDIDDLVGRFAGAAIMVDSDEEEEAEAPEDGDDVLVNDLVVPNLLDYQIRFDGDGIITLVADFGVWVESNFGPPFFGGYTREYQVQ